MKAELTMGLLLATARRIREAFDVIDRYILNNIILLSSLYITLMFYLIDLI